MKFTGHFTGAKLDLSAYLQQLEAHLTNELHRVTKKWLRAVTGRVPVWSGMSRGSLKRVALEIGTSLVITPKHKSRVNLGISFGDVDAKYGPTDFTIVISTRVPHYVLQESKNVGVSKSAPWQSFEAGNAAYLAAVESVRLPVPKFKPVKYKVE